MIADLHTVKHAQLASPQASNEFLQALYTSFDGPYCHYRAVYHLMIDTLATNGEVDAAFKLLKEMEEALKGDSALKATPYVTLASAFAVADRLEEAVDILLRMKGRKMVVTTQNLVGVRPVFPLLCYWSLC
jgi:pentatricopeptide repeat protein